MVSKKRLRDAKKAQGEKRKVPLQQSSLTILTG